MTMPTIDKCLEWLRETLSYYHTEKEDELFRATISARLLAAQEMEKALEECKSQCDEDFESIADKALAAWRKAGEE